MEESGGVRTDGNGWDGMGWVGLNGIGWGDVGWEGWDGLGWGGLGWDGVAGLTGHGWEDLVTWTVLRWWRCSHRSGSFPSRQGREASYILAH